MKLYHFIIIICVGIIVFLMKQSIIDLCNLEKCPYCYGTNLCEDFVNNQITLVYENSLDFTYNLFNIKNVYMGKYFGKRVVLKKLAHTKELEIFDKQSIKPIDDSDLEDLLINLNNFKLCHLNDSKRFLNYIKTNYNNYELWTILQINVEPILLEIFKFEDNWPVPQLYGACGRIIVETYCGISLNDFVNYDWFKRLYLAKQLLHAAINFTDKHPDFRLYLTDISSDNIVVDPQNLNIYFIDLENAIITYKSTKYCNNKADHVSQHFDDEDGFVFNHNEICDHPRSDHNIYAICRLILSQEAPWPMMQGGLLHSSPSDYQDLFDLIEDCAIARSNRNRFETAAKLLDVIDGIVNKFLI